METARYLSDWLILAKKPMHGIAVMKTAISSLCKPEEISGFHTQFTKLCLKAKCYQHSLRIIQEPITQVMLTTSAIEVISYNYYRGLLFTGLHMYQEALDSFNKVFILPAQLLHQVHVDAFKKASLVSLIHSGKKFELPEKTVDSLRNAFIKYASESDVPYGSTVAPVNVYHIINEIHAFGKVGDLETAISNNLETL